MKIGPEVEGVAQGALTLFCTHLELNGALRWLREAQVDPDSEHRGPVPRRLYIMDHDNQLTSGDYSALHAAVQELKLVRITVEVKAYPIGIPRYTSIFYMVCVDVDPRVLGIFNEDAHPLDQVKFSHNLYVAAKNFGAFVLTTPEDFSNDIEI